jgi:HPt (histidine-containing phosphotransfer) domain-containing protein
MAEHQGRTGLRIEASVESSCAGGALAGEGGAATAAPLIDPQSIERLRQLDPSGQQGVLDRVLRAYEASLGRHLDDVALSLSTGDLDRMARAAHTLKSSSAAVGALTFAQLCADIEHVLRSLKVMPPAPQVEALIHEGARVKVAVGAMLSAK